MGAPGQDCPVLVSAHNPPSAFRSAALRMLEAIGEVAVKTVEVGAEAAEKTSEIAAETIEVGTETGETAIHELGSARNIIVTPDMVVIKESSLKSLMQSNIEGTSHKVTDVKTNSVFDEIKGKAKIPVVNETANAAEGIEGTSAEKTGLTEDEKAKIIKETGWSSEIVNCIESMDQYEVYKNADLHEAEIDGRKCLVKDIDMDYVDPKTGLTNRELMEKGRAPIDAKTGESIELHHMGQNFNSPFAELCANSEHGDGKDAILHDKKVESWRQDPEKKNQYNNVQRPNHWKARAKEV